MQLASCINKKVTTFKIKYGSVPSHTGRHLNFFSDLKRYQIIEKRDRVRRLSMFIVENSKCLFRPQTFEQMLVRPYRGPVGWQFSYFLS